MRKRQLRCKNCGPLFTSPKIPKSPVKIFSSCYHLFVLQTGVTGAETVARAIYRGRVSQYPGRLVKLAIALASWRGAIDRRRCRKRVHFGASVGPRSIGLHAAVTLFDFATASLRRKFALWQHGFELPLRPFQVTTQLRYDGMIHEVRTVHVAG